MASVKLNISLDEEIAQALRERAAELRKPASRYLADLVEEDMRRREDELAAEGYRPLSEDTGRFAEDALRVAGETWPEWHDDLECDPAQPDASEADVAPSEGGGARRSAR